METKEGNTEEAVSRMRMKKRGITKKLVSAIIVIDYYQWLLLLLFLVYNRVSDALLTKSESLLGEATDKAVQETSAWMNKNAYDAYDAAGIRLNTRI